MTDPALEKFLFRALDVWATMRERDAVRHPEREVERIAEEYPHLFSGG